MCTLLLFKENGELCTKKSKLRLYLGFYKLTGKAHPGSTLRTQSKCHVSTV